MKRVLCLLMVAVMCLGLTGCASEKKANVTGEWYVLVLGKLDESIARQPTKLTDLPEAMQAEWSGCEVTFRKVSDSLTIIEMIDGDEVALMFAHLEASGDWALYGVDRVGQYAWFKDGEGATGWLDNKDNADPFTYTLSGNTLTLSTDDTSRAGEVEMWDKNVLILTQDDERGLDQWAFIRVDKLLNDGLRLK